MARVLLIGDMHIKISNFSTALVFLQWLKELVIEQKPDLIVNLGDVWDTHAVIRSEIACEFLKHIYDTTSSGVEYIYVLGNHDMFKPNDSKYHAMLPYKGRIPNLSVIDKISNREDLGITFVPYMPKDSDFPIKTLPICIAHQTFVGCDFGGYKPEDGVDADKISAELIVSGHIHKRQSFGKVYYPGSPYSQGMKDIGQVKGISILDTDTYKIEFIQTPLPVWRKLEIQVSSVAETISNIKTSINSTDHWVVLFIGNRKDIAAVLDSKDWKSLCGINKISVRTEYIDSNRVERVKIKANTVIDVAEEYIDKIYAGGVDKKTIKTTMRQLFDNYSKNNV